MLRALEPDIAIITAERFGDGVFARGVLGAIHAAPREQAGDLSDADAEHLPGQDVIDALFQARNLVLEPFVKASGYLAEEHAGLSAWVKELRRLVRPEVRAAVVGGPRLGQRIEHPVRE